MKIGVYSPNWIGDAVMALPFIHHLKEKNPEHDKIPQLTHLVCQLYTKLGDKEKAKMFENELLAIAPDKHAKYYK